LGIAVPIRLSRDWVKERNPDSPGMIGARERSGHSATGADTEDAGCAGPVDIAKSLKIGRASVRCLRR
jgi:hypothetical protein